MCMQSQQQSNTDSQQEEIDSTYMVRELTVIPHVERRIEATNMLILETKQPKMMQSTVWLPD